MGRDPPLVTGRPWSPGLMDVADTFAESDVTLSHTKTEVASEGVHFDPGSLSSATGTGSSQGTDSNNNDHGLVFTPSRKIKEVQVSAPSYGGDAYLTRKSDGTELASDTGVSGGGTAVLTPSNALESGNEYLVTYRNTGGSREIIDNSFPVSTVHGEITAGWSGSKSTNSCFHWLDIATVPAYMNGSVTISWPLPDDLAGWDIVPFQVVEDGGTVEVYAEDENGNELAGPLSDPGDISAVSRSTNVHLRVDLSRSSTSENPRLEAIYRRYKV